ncbi:DUF2637 domain-containing protein [Streptomyces erythrochromogenes]|uniref:DUF2637 domain-containing protein n=1 Tax=Streptomyces erythrochromogenes TaxID=285574 RepID=UPI00380FF453
MRVAPVSAWDRMAIVALGTAGCALSYDALQQMAVAIHVRGFLTYLFPLVVDGFIAYGVRALLVLASAPLRARLYVWTLFGTATAASIWANALHAVRLNQQTILASGLRLGDTVVAVLSTLAPLALAGAVHLYILITRHQVGSSPRTNGADQRTKMYTDHEAPSGRRIGTEQDHQSGPDQQRPRAADAAGQPNGAAGPGSGQGVEPGLPNSQGSGPAAGPRPGDNRAPGELLRTDLGPDSEAPSNRTSSAAARAEHHLGPAQASGPHPAGPTPAQTPGPHPAGPTPDQTPGPHPAGPTPDQTPGPHPAGPTPDQTPGPPADPVPLEVLLPIAREAALAGGRMTRRVIGPYLREKNLPIGNERFAELQEVLYRDPALSHLPRPKRSTTVAKERLARG